MNIYNVRYESDEL